MIIARIPNEARDRLSYAFQQAVQHNEVVIVGYDWADDAIKFKIGNGTWSPPIPIDRTPR